MNTEKKEEFLVSVIIPVYNAEAYLGYCLNSAMGQSYTNIEVIIVNDGSTDGSLEICRQYEAIDPRFQVIDIPNGGVSHARNTALSKSRGDYLIFLDSDDTLHPQIIEKMMEAEKKYQTGLVIGDVQMVDFSTAQVLPTKLTIAHPDTKRLYNKSEFRCHKMSLIWLTALLEGPYCKLFRADLWKKNRVMFPENVSLGEDFLANMRYFDACNGVFFLEEIGYYYNNLQNSTSLSHKFRADIFQNKMMLIEHLRKHLGKFDKLKPFEQECYYNYVASYGLFCVKHILLADDVGNEIKLPMLQKICEHDVFISSLDKATYTHPDYSQFVDPLRQNQPAELLRIIVKEHLAVIQQPKPGFLNRTLQRCLRMLGKLLGTGKLSKNVQKLEKSIADVGIKNTLQRCRPEDKRIKTRFLKKTIKEHPVAIQQPMPGFLNRAFRRCLKMLGKLLGTGKLSVKILKLEKSIKDVGIKNTIRRYMPEDKRVKTRLLLLMEEQKKMQIQIHALSEAFFAQSSSQQSRLNDLEWCLQSMSDKNANQFQALESVLTAQAATHQEHIKAIEENLICMSDKNANQFQALESVLAAQAATHQEHIKAIEENLICMSDKNANQFQALESVLAAQAATHQEHIKAIEENLICMSNENANQFQALESAFAAQTANLDKIIMNLGGNITGQMKELEDNLIQQETRCKEEIRIRTQEVKDRLWLSECRQDKKLQHMLGNSLRQRKKAIIFGTSEHRNLGDAAIVVAEQALLREVLPEYYQLEFSSYESEEHYQFIRSTVNEEDIIFIQGGGNLGSLYTEEEQLHRRVITDFPNNKIVILPQTIHFANNKTGKQELALSQAVYNKHRDLNILCRGQKSFAMAKEYFPQAHCYLTPDIVLSLNRDYCLPRKGVLLCLRDDGEKVFTSAQKGQIEALLSSMQLNVEQTNNMAPEDVSRELRFKYVDDELRRFASKELVITDRLHGAIFSLITDTPVVLLQSSDYKISDYYETFLKDEPNVFYAGNNLEVLDEGIEKLLTSKSTLEFSSETPKVRKQLGVILQKILKISEK